MPSSVSQQPSGSGVANPEVAQAAQGFDEMTAMIRSVIAETIKQHFESSEPQQSSDSAQVQCLVSAQEGRKRARDAAQHGEVESCRSRMQS